MVTDKAKNKRQMKKKPNHIEDKVLEKIAAINAKHSSQLPSSKSVANNSSIGKKRSPQPPASKSVANKNLRHKKPRSSRDKEDDHNSESGHRSQRCATHAEGRARPRWHER